MYDLTIIRKNGGAYIDSREVAVAIDKRHDHLLRDIGNYCEIISRRGLPKIGESDFFIKSSYINAQNREMPCYLVSRAGCDLIAHKLTGEKGVLFTCAYVTKFRELEQREQTEPEVSAVKPRRPAPRLGEVNACSRLIIRGMKALGATPEQVMQFLKETYEPLGFCLSFDICGTTASRWHNACGIAGECGMYALSGRPHGQAAARILNDVLFISEDHKRFEKDHYGFQAGVSTLYDDFALLAVTKWIRDNERPEAIAIGGTTYRVRYRF